LLLGPEIGIVRLIFFLCELLTHLTMVWNRTRSMFYTSYGLSIMVFPSYQPRLSACIVSRTRTFKAIIYESRIYQLTRSVWIFHQVVPSLVFETVGILCPVHRAFTDFDDSDWDLAQFVELTVFPICDYFLVSWSRDIEPRLA
jgi:hypothetical protein